VGPILSRFRGRDAEFWLHIWWAGVMRGLTMAVDVLLAAALLTGVPVPRWGDGLLLLGNVAVLATLR